MIVVVFTLIQGPTLPFLARVLKLSDGGEARDLDVEAAPLEELNADLLQMRIPPESKLHGVEIFELRLPSDAAVTMVVRDGHSFVPDGSTRLKRDDQLLVVTTAAQRRIVEKRLRAVSRRGKLAGWYGETGTKLPHGNVAACQLPYHLAVAWAECQVTEEDRVPTYQYACTSCGEQLEVVQKFTDDALTECPACAGRLRKVFNAVGIVFKGSGFYRTDNRSSTSSSATTSSPSSPKPATESKPADSGSSSGSASTSEHPREHSGGLTCCEAGCPQEAEEGRTGGAGDARVGAMVNRADIGVIGGSGFYSCSTTPRRSMSRPPTGLPATR